MGWMRSRGVLVEVGLAWVLVLGVIGVASLRIRGRGGAEFRDCYHYGYRHGVSCGWDWRGGDGADQLAGVCNGDGGFCSGGIDVCDDWDGGVR